MTEVNLTLDTAKFINKLAAGSTTPLYELTPEQARQVLSDAQSQPTARPDADVDDIKIPLQSGQTLAAKIVRPRKARKILPVIFYIHGGGWVMGDEHTHDRLLRELAVGAEAAVIFPEYPRSPEAKYPQALMEMFEALQYIAHNAEELNLNAGKIALAGDSVGGNMATVLALMAKENNRPKIIFQLLFYPVTDANFDTVSYNDYAQGPWLTKPAMQWFWDAYAPDPRQRTEITVSPLQADINHLEGMPPTLIITAENDVLRDEGEAYARKLIAAGVDVSAVRINNTIHDFVMLNALAKSNPTRLAISLASTALHNAFYQKHYRCQ